MTEANEMIITEKEKITRLLSMLNELQRKCKQAEAGADIEIKNIKLFEANMHKFE